MIASTSRRRAAAAFVLAWCVVAAALAVDAPRPAQAEDPPTPHTDNLGDDGLDASSPRCDIESPPSHSSGGACYLSTHRPHRRLDHYQKQQDGPLGWADTDQTTVMSCPRTVVDQSASDHGMGASKKCEPPEEPDEPDVFRWRFVKIEYPGSGHNVVWHASTTDTTNVAPVFQPPTIHRSEVTCCGAWSTVATLRALDANVVQVSGVWQDDLRFKSRSSDSTLGVSRLSNARFLLGGGGQDVDVNLSGLSPGDAVDRRRCAGSPGDGHGHHQDRPVHRVGRPVDHRDIFDGL